MFELPQKLQTVGTGCCDFQANPEPAKNPDGTWDIRTDWEKAIIDSRNAGPMENPDKTTAQKRIRGDLNALPDFDRDYKKQMDDAADELNNSAFRMSLDFGRLCPRPEEFDEKLMGEYLKKIAYCRKKGMDPVVTLHHWPMPLSFCEIKPNGTYVKGAWEHPEILKHLEFYIKKLTEYLFNPQKIRQILEQDPDFTSEEIDEMLNDGTIARTFITINEPVCHFLVPYWVGEFPPFKKGKFKTGRKVLQTVGEAHHIAWNEMNNAVDRIPDIQNDVRLGVAHNYIYFEGHGPVTRRIAKHLDQKINWNAVDIVEKDGKESDFYGIQYYHREDISWAGLRHRITGKDSRKNYVYGDHPGFGDIYPQGIQSVIGEVSKRYPEKKIKVTEFGFADRTDRRRPFWIMETIKCILESKEKGANIDGVILWANINNLEWSAGMDIQFGLYDHNGNRLPSDDGTQISSREVWSILSTYLNNPTEQNKAVVEQLYAKAKEQYELVLSKPPIHA